MSKTPNSWIALLEKYYILGKKKSQFFFSTASHLRVHVLFMQSYPDAEPELYC